MKSIVDQIRIFFDIKFWKFLAVGILNTVVGMALVFGLYNLTPLGYWPASALGYILASILSFVLNRNFTFQHQDQVAKQAFRFALNIALCYLLAYGIAKPIIYRLFSAFSVKFRDNIALVAGSVLFAAFNYIGQRFFVFAKKREK